MMPLTVGVFMQPERAHIEPAQCLQAALDEARQRDPIGDRIHLGLAAFYLLTLALKTAPNGFAYGFLLTIAVLRLPHTWRSYRFVLRCKIVWLLLAWGGWYALSLLWSNNTAQGLDELGSCRVIVVPMLLWPVIDQARLLIGAFLTGVAVQNLVQLGQGLHLLPRPEADGDRLRGLIHPIQTGAICAAAMCWHLSAALHGQRWVRWLSLLGLFAAGCGLVFTGSRGPWIAATVAVPLGLVITAARRPPLRRRALQLTVLGAIAAIVLIPLTWNVITSRYAQAMQEMQKAESGKLNTDVGFRLASWSTAWQLFKQAPIQGMGAGGYKELARQGPHKRALKKASHAHSLYMHVLACSGVVGSSIVLALIVTMLVQSARAPAIHLYADGHLFVLLTWLIGAVFDAYQLNGLLFGLLAVIVALLAAAHCGNGRDITSPTVTQS